MLFLSVRHLLAVRTHSITTADRSGGMLRCPDYDGARDVHTGEYEGTCRVGLLCQSVAGFCQYNPGQPSGKRERVESGPEFLNNIMAGIAIDRQ